MTKLATRQFFLSVCQALLYRIVSVATSTAANSIKQNNCLHTVLISPRVWRTDGQIYDD